MSETRNVDRRTQFDAHLVHCSEVDVASLTSSDSIIAVVGPTGSGKSTFIETVTGLKGKVGHNLESFTSEISAVRVIAPEFRNVVFVDTPGFDDTHKSDVEIFNLISAWLNETYQRNIQLSGLLYFHRISDNRMAGSPLKNLRIFEKICGKNFNKIVLTTSMWDEVEEEVGSRREKELRDVYWNTMVHRGSTVKRFHRDWASVMDVLSPIITDLDKTKPLLLQEEVTGLGLTLKQTTAGHALYLELEELVTANERSLSKLRKEAETATPEDLQELFEEFRRLNEQLQASMIEARKMRATFLERVRSAVLQFISLRHRTNKPDENKDESAERTQGSRRRLSHTSERTNGH